MNNEPDRSESQTEIESPLLSRASGLALVLVAASALGFYVCYRLLYYFIPSLVWALTLSVIANRMHDRIRARLKHPNLAAVLAVTIIGFGIIAPGIFVGQSIVTETGRGAAALRRQTQSEQWKETVEKHPLLARALGRIQPYMDVRGLVERTANTLGYWLSVVVGESIWILAQLLIMLFALFYMFRDHDTILNKIRSFVPLSRSETDMLFTGVSNTIYATIYGIFAVALLQGILGGLIFWWLDLPAPVLWGVVMALLALIPVLGAPVVWVPAAIYLALSGSWPQAFILTAWGVIVIGVIDNLIYPILVGDKMRMHTLLIFFSVVGGLFLFGSSGLILGPLAVVITSMLMEIWRHRVSAKRICS